ncbi:SRPBCC domain-containing protein [Microlunatus sp. Gsoil 973]|uniref:SRPBCC domain-containing protein n=1 Tax=Microlunatus sp. Gsoil 973 TaxID=2672569 RepID=UPI0012B4A23E|nr:SRPBCC domain-containing protein [Microlunatus sp. Gsoil 973]QGN33344.1 polyketide cyclase [Microlunatus sp. Gsoil 973]
MSTNTNQTREATIIADPDLPKVTITREFDAPADKVFTAHVDPDIFARWIGPNQYDVTIDRWEATTGGSYRYATGEEWFFGSFHEVQPDQRRIVQTWGWEGLPGAVSLETCTVTDLPDGRSLLTSVSLVDSMEAQAAMLASGMEVGINDGYAKLDELLKG